MLLAWAVYYHYIIYSKYTSAFYMQRIIIRGGKNSNEENSFSTDMHFVGGRIDFRIGFCK